MTQVTWLLHQEILDRLIYHRRKLPECIEAAGHKVILVSWEILQPLPKIPDLTGPVVLYGSHSFVREVLSTLDPSVIQPGALGLNERTKASQYLSYLPPEWFLNRFADFMTWSMFKWRIENLPFGLPWNKETGKLFIRPDSGFKTFAGTVLDINKDLALDIKTIDEHSSVMPETMILMNTAYPLQGEFRFVIADKQVITGSEYRWDGKLDIRRDWPVECFQLAQEVAMHDWQVDIAYTCDVALTENGPKVIELNGFSCAGMYACNMDEVVPAVSDAAIKEYMAGQP